jgi:hypothetical protein
MVFCPEEHTQHLGEDCAVIARLSAQYGFDTARQCPRATSAPRGRVGRSRTAGVLALTVNSCLMLCRGYCGRTDRTLAVQRLLQACRAILCAVWSLKVRSRAAPLASTLC